MIEEPQPLEGVVDREEAVSALYPPEYVRTGPTEVGAAVRADPDDDDGRATGRWAVEHADAPWRDRVEALFRDVGVGGQAAIVVDGAVVSASRL